ncbi:hypothetical protein EJ08DRAFT_421060 [Tothia fuscella]|uniref:Uncharacterized protein n=1 Tax=Tothia fuscella TaxID=1048955 RepID=A0A9P4NK73_9PEZI|nr:hypothetical protein EJ08DRAFT_421060 [Tothia fuscella]
MFMLKVRRLTFLAATLSSKVSNFSLSSSLILQLLDYHLNQHYTHGFFAGTILATPNFTQNQHQLSSMGSFGTSTISSSSSSELHVCLAATIAVANLNDLHCLSKTDLFGLLISRGPP